MKSTLFRATAILALVLCFLPSVYSQVIKGDLIIGDTSQIHQVTTKRGDVFLGRVTQIQNTEVRFLFNKTIELTFQLTDLQEISVVDPARVGQKYSYDGERKEFLKKSQPFHGHERGFLLPTGFLLKKGVKEYRNVGFIYSSFDYGLTDNLNVGAGAIPLLAANLFQFKLRAGTSLGEMVHLSLNANAYLGFAIEAGATTAASATGALTVGRPERNLTAGGGYGFGFGGSLEEGVFIGNVGGSYQVDRNWRILGEVLISINQPGLFLFTGGANWITGNHRLEFGIGAVRVDFNAIPYPFLGYAYRF
ncbi:MAG: hypothetical protein IPH04_09150 [Saprospirales bacterium]|nr:hypothetical protein [Saprospirales bacterium]